MTTTGTETVRETSTWRAMGSTDEITTCDHCGRDDLKGTVRMVLVTEIGEEDGEQFMGTVCAARMTGRKATEIRTEAVRADREREAARVAAERAESDRRHAAEQAAFAAWVLDRYGVTTSCTADLWGHKAITGKTPFALFCEWKDGQ